MFVETEFVCYVCEKRFVGVSCAGPTPLLQRDSTTLSESEPETWEHRVSLPGAVACSCNPATRRQVLLDGLRRGLLVVTGSCWSGVRTKACINMDPPGEPGGVRLTKEGRTGPGGKLSSQESPCESVVGPHQWVVSGHQPLQHSQTQNFLNILCSQEISKAVKEQL